MPDSSETRCGFTVATPASIARAPGRRTFGALRIHLQLRYCIVKNKYGITASILALLAASAVSVSQRAEAGCDMGASSLAPAPGTVSRHFLHSAVAGNGLVQAVWTSGAGPDAFGAQLLKTSWDDHDELNADGLPHIVGLWRFKFISEGSKGIPDGTVVDAGYTTWHSDGTELMNSGRLPSTGDFCMGVWKALGSGTYKLNHYALAFDPTGTTLVGPANIRETVVLDRARDEYTGRFTLDQYSIDNQTILAHVQGIVTASRITVDCKGACAK